MMARRLLAILFALTLFSSSGCCWVRRLLCDDCCSPCGNGAFTYYAGRSCGEQYCGDWISHPPCDPCDDCGHNVGCCEVQRPGRCLLWPIRRLFNFGRCVGQCAMADECGCAGGDSCGCASGDSCGCASGDSCGCASGDGFVPQGY